VIAIFCTDVFKVQMNRIWKMDY